MKINIQYVEGNVEGANVMLNTIANEVLEEIKGELGNNPDIRLEELSATFTVKPEGEKDYFILSAEHDGVKEALEIDYDLRAGVQEDNIEESNYTESDKAQILTDLGGEFETVEPKLDDQIDRFVDQRIVGDMVVRNFLLKDGRKATRVLQEDKTSGGYRLIQEFSFKEDIDDTQDYDIEGDNYDE